MVQPFQLKKVKQILPFLFSHFFPVHGILHKHENRCPFLFLSYTQEPPLRQPVNKHPWKNENFGMSTNILSKKKQKTEDACISHWQKVSSKGSTTTKSFYRISTAPQAIAKKTPKKSNITNLIKKKITMRLALEYTYNSCRCRLIAMSRS